MARPAITGLCLIAALSWETSTVNCCQAYLNRLGAHISIGVSAPREVFSGQSLPRVLAVHTGLEAEDLDGDWANAGIANNIRSINHVVADIWAGSSSICKATWCDSVSNRTPRYYRKLPEQCKGQAFAQADLWRCYSESLPFR
jgi:hypothetical protein